METVQTGNRLINCEMGFVMLSYALVACLIFFIHYKIF